MVNGGVSDNGRNGDTGNLRLPGSPLASVVHPIVRWVALSRSPIQSWMAVFFRIPRFSKRLSM